MLSNKASFRLAVCQMGTRQLNWVAQAASAHSERFDASTTQVPRFALFGFVAPQASDAFSANNAKCGTLLLAD